MSHRGPDALETEQHDDRPLQPLGAMPGRDRDSVLARPQRLAIGAGLVPAGERRHERLQVAQQADDRGRIAVGRGPAGIGGRVRPEGIQVREPLGGLAPAGGQGAEVGRGEHGIDGGHRAEVRLAFACGEHPRDGRIRGEGLAAGGVERPRDHSVEIGRVGDAARQIGGRERVARIDPQPQPGDDHLGLDGREQAHARDDRRDAERAERVGDGLALLVGPTQHGDVAEGGTSRSPAIAHQRRAGEQVADPGGGRGGTTGLVIGSLAAVELERPVLGDRAEPVRLVLEVGTQPGSLLRHSLAREGSREDLAGDGDEAGPAAKRRAEGLDAATDRVHRARDELRIRRDRRQGLDGGVHQRGVRAAEREDRLLRIADPDRLGRELRELEEHGELDRASVLEFVDEEQVELPGEGRAHVGPTKERERERLLIDEVDDPGRALVVLIGGERVPGDLEQERDQPPEIRSQARVLDVALRELLHGEGVGTRSLGRRPLRDRGPGPPRRRSRRVEVARTLPEHLHILGRAGGDVAVRGDRRARGLDLIDQRPIEVVRGHRSEAGVEARGSTSRHRP